MIIIVENVQVVERETANEFHEFTRMGIEMIRNELEKIRENS